MKLLQQQLLTSYQFSAQMKLGQPQRIIETEKIPIKMWLDDLEGGALSQAKNLANFPYAYKHIPIMPDSHQGYGMPIGSILASDQVVIPNGVGNDIGCGMCAVKTNIKFIKKNKLEEIMELARQNIPVGYNSHKKAQNIQFMPEQDYRPLRIIKSGYRKALHQIGTLGGGNHFLEIQKGNDRCIWVMIHSGSRGLGSSVAQYYNQLALDFHRPDPNHFKELKSSGLAYLYLDSIQGQEYIKEMNYCIEYALANRLLMMKRILKIMEQVRGKFKIQGEIINKSHNFASWESHFGKRVLVHRKGAMRAEQGEIGMIPGSQGTKSYIVKGKGEPESFNSCSHGAGRKLSRKKAKEQLNLEEEQAILDNKGVVHNMKTKKDLDEAPSAYKDIDEVMENQRDLADILVELTPMAVLKG